MIFGSVGWSKYYDDDDEELDTKVGWGTFLPLRIRSLLLNMSRYFYDDILAADSQAEFIASDKFLGALTIFIRETSSLNQLFDRKSSTLSINWGFLQVLKVLFEGQARQQQSVLTLKKIFEPVYS